jgi:hypothetical protein
MSVIMNHDTINTAELDVRLSEASTIEQRLAVFGEILEVRGPVSKEVLFGALQDPTYARNLLVSRRSPGHLSYLLSHPPVVEIPEEDARMPSNGELMKNVASGLIKWARTGFSIVDETTLRKREDACLACPHLVVPTRLLQRLLPSHKETTKTGRRTGDKVCDLCGCSVSRKMRLTSEFCPSKDPNQPAVTRWGQPSAGR